MQKATYEDMCQAYSDAFKAYHGVRPLSGYSQHMTMDEMGEAVLQFYRWVEEDAKWQREQEDRAINACMDCGAPDIATAMRWLEDAYEMEWA